MPASAEDILPQFEEKSRSFFIIRKYHAVYMFREENAKVLKVPLVLLTAQWYSGKKFDLRIGRLCLQILDVSITKDGKIQYQNPTTR